MKNKKLMTLFFMSFMLFFMTPIVMASDLLQAAEDAIGTDIVGSLISGITGALTSISGILLVFRRVKGQVEGLGSSTQTFLNSLSDKLQKVVNNEITLKEFTTDVTSIVLDMKKVYTTAIQNLQVENENLKIEMQGIRSQFPTFVRIAREIKQTETNIMEAIKLFAMGLPDLVKAGFTEQILKVGEVINEEQN